MKRLAFLIGLILIANLVPLLGAQAARGEPGSQQFGFGGTIYSDGQYLNEALYLSQNLGLDWVQIDVSWKEIWPDPSQPANWIQLDQTLSFFNNRSTSIMLSLTDAPAWVMTPGGPDANLAAAFLGQVLSRYPNCVQAIELFPRANTLSGWGSQPDPAAYMALYTTIKNSLQASAPSLLLVAGGLQPAQTDPQAGVLSDLEFLQGLYNSGARDQVAVLSLDFSTLTNDPTTPPSPTEPRLLRRYEDIRRVMVDNQHANALLWISHMRVPGAYTESSSSAWITRAYAQLRSQLYVGVVFYDSLNPPNPEKYPANPNTLLLTDSQYSANYEILKTMIKQNSNGSLADMPGRPKGNEIIKGNK